MILSTELTLILECTRLPAHPDTPARIHALIRRGIRWDKLLQSAIPHGVLPLVAHSLSSHSGGSVPEEILAQLRLLLARTRTRNDLQSEALNHAIQGLTAAGIPVLAFKGPALGALAYGDFGLREFHDLDLWTDKRDLARAGQALLNLDYRAVTTKAGRVVDVCNPGKRHTWFASANHEVNIELQDLEVATQFHFRPEFSELWKRRQLVRFGNLCVPTLGTEDLLVALAAHGSKHVWRRLSWIMDIAGLIEHAPDLDWARTQELAIRWHSRRRLLGGLALAARLYSPPMPEYTRTTIMKDRYASELVEAYLSRILPGNGRGTRRPEAGRWNAITTSSREIVHHCRSTDRGSDRLSVAATELVRRFQWLAYSVRDLFG